MQARELSSLIRFVLLSTAATAACGGMIEPTENGESSEDGERDVFVGTSTSSSSSGDGKQDTTSGRGGCEMGVLPLAEELCCPEGETCLDRAYGTRPDADGGPVVCDVDCVRVCAAVGIGPGNFLNCSWSSATEISYACGACGVGRVAAGTAPHALGGTLGERLARQAYYEAASVTAFARLAGVLAAEGAPWDLVRRAQRAAEEEARHAATFATLAEQHGAAPCVPEPSELTPTLFELAIENATEGCVRETFGALVTLYQAEHAESAEVRAAFASVAEDELQHAALSWDLHAWFETRLGDGELEMMHDAYKIARRAAERDVMATPDAIGTAVGLPSDSRATAMFRSLMRGLDSLRATREAA